MSISNNVLEPICSKNGCKSYRKFINEKSIEQCNNKYYKNVIDPNLVFTNLHQSSDNIAILTTMHNNIINPYEVKINLLKYVIQNPDFKIGSTITNIKDFFNTLNPLNNEFQMGSYKWSYKCINNNGKELFLVQNSLFKKNIYNTPNVYTDYIDLIKKILDRSGIVFHYHEFRTKRFYKRVDTIFLFYI
jgi:hypothetical protein